MYLTCLWAVAALMLGHDDDFLKLTKDGVLPPHFVSYGCACSDKSYIYKGARGELMILVSHDNEERQVCE